MQWHTHSQIGLTTLWLWQLLPHSVTDGQLPLIMAFTVLGALLPDLDAAESKLKHVMLGGIKPFVLPAQAIHRQWGHRGFTHSLRALAFLFMPAALLAPVTGWQCGLALLMGYVSHLAADACTKTGIPFLYPNLKRYWLVPVRFRIVTGSSDEEAVFVVAASVVLAFLLSHLHIIQ